MVLLNASNHKIKIIGLNIIKLNLNILDYKTTFKFNFVIVTFIFKIILNIAYNAKMAIIRIDIMDIA